MTGKTCIGSTHRQVDMGRGNSTHPQDRPAHHGVCLRYVMALELDRANLSQVLRDNFLDELGMDTHGGFTAATHYVDVDNTDHERL